MKDLFFIEQYIKMPRTVGAVVPSSKYLADRMIEDVCFNDARYIVEYGPGTGVFTRKLIENKRQDTVILLIEYNYKFYRLLKEKYKDEENIYIIHDSAENIDKYLKQFNIPHIDYVVSGLPFASLPKNISSAILDKTKAFLKNDGKFITFQYSLLKKEFIQQFFNEIKVKREYRNIPPAYVLSCSNSD